MSLKNRELIFELLMKQNTRIELTRQSLFWFGWWYFNDFFTHASPKFHMEMVRSLEFKEGFKYLILEMFKESAKTSWAKIAFVKRICFKEGWFQGWVSHDKEKSEASLFDVAIQLQTNKRLLADFGQLFYEQTLSDEKKSKKKSIDEFVTANGIKAKAYSTSMSTRGEIHASHRPDFMVLDDFENEKTKKSVARTQEVKNFIDELLSGVGASINMVFLCNKIANNGSVDFLEKKAAGNPDFKLMKKALVEDGEITWKSKFVWTDLKANLINVDAPKEKKVFSIEERKRTLGTSRFNQEYLLKPINENNPIFKKAWFENNVYSSPLSTTLKREVMVGDPQAGEKQTADFFGVCVVSWYPGESHRYVEEIHNFKGSTLEQAAEFIKIWQRRPLIVFAGVEVVLNQTALYQTILEWKKGKINLVAYGVDDSNRNIPFGKVSPEGKDKVARAQIHEPACERGEIHFHVSLMNFIDKLTGFPDVEHDDDIDAWIYCLDLANKSVYTKNELKQNDDEDKESKTITGGILNKKF